MRKYALVIGGIVLGCAILIVAAIEARSLIALNTPVPWLRAEAPFWAERGGEVELRLSLDTPQEGVYLGADLHGARDDYEGLGFQASAPTQPMSAGRREYTFSVRVPDKGELAYVEPIIFAAPDGSWEHRSIAVRLPLIPVTKKTPLAAAPPLSQTRAYPLGDRRVSVRRESRGFRALAAILFAICAAGALGLTVKRGEPKDRHRAFALAFACLAACVWEIMLPEASISSFLRRFARYEGLYRMRRGPQLLIDIIVIGLGVFGGVALIARARARRRTASGFAWLGLYAYACIALLRIVSEHYIDAFMCLDLPVLGLQLGQGVRLACAALVLGALIAISSCRPSGRGSA